MIETRAFDFRPVGPRIIVTVDWDRLGAMLAGKANRTTSRTGKRPKRVSILASAIVAKVTDR